MAKADYPVLSGAPIVEAVLDIRVTFSENINIDTVHALHEKIKNQFPIEQQQYAFTGEFQLRPQKDKIESSSSSGALINGYLFYSEDKKKIFQARLSGFTFHLQKPYSTWNEFKAEARRYWEIYKDSLKPLTINRVALRYINKIELGAKFTPTKYFQTIPVLGKKLAGYEMNNLFSQITIKNPGINAKANITQGVEPPSPGQEIVSNFVFDIDTYCVGDFNEEEIWNKFEELRDFKNEIFFESITEETLNLLK